MKSVSQNPPYGGTLIQKIVDASDELSLEEKQFCLELDDFLVSDAINIATGGFSPLSGFMTQKDFEEVCRRNCLFDSKLPWTIPILLDISEEEKSKIKSSQKVFLKSKTTQKIIGWIEPKEVFSHNKELYCSSVFATSDVAHPGVGYLSQMKPYLLAGDIFLFSSVLSEDPMAYPNGVRKKLSSMQLFSVAGFQTRNVVHRAHEYLQRIAMELVGGILIHPVVGWKKVGDFQPEAIRASYSHFIREYYPQNKAVLAFLNLAMRYAGPKEAVFHAIVRKNFGCSHFIVGRDHAGVGNFYSTYAAHDIFDQLPSLGIEILRLKGPFYCRKCDGIATDSTCGHSEAEREYISGTKIRQILSKGDDPQTHIFRPSILSILNNFKKQELFYE